MQHDHDHEPDPDRPPAAVPATPQPLVAGPLTVARVLALQRTAGNSAVVRLARDGSDAGTKQAPPPPPPPPKRETLVFIMGSDDHGFYWAAERFFKDHPPAPGATVQHASNLADIHSKIAGLPANTLAGDVYIVSHATPAGLNFGMDAADTDNRIARSDLETAAPTLKAAARATGKYDAQTAIHIRGCNLGRNAPMVQLVNDAFGDVGTTEAPTHRTEYLVDAKTQVSTEGVAEYAVTFPPSGHTTQTVDSLATAFEARYHDMAIPVETWKKHVEKTFGSKPKPNDAAHSHIHVANFPTAAQETDAELTAQARKDYNDLDNVEFNVDRTKGRIFADVVRYTIPARTVEGGKTVRSLPGGADVTYGEFFTRANPRPVPVPPGAPPPPGTVVP